METLHNVKIRQMEARDIPSILGMQGMNFPTTPGWTEDQLLHHLEIFPEGQIVAVDENDQVIGSASALMIDWDDYSESANWAMITDNGSFNTNNPIGKTLYGAELAVSPEARRSGIGTLLYNYRKKMVKEKGLKRLLVGGRIPGYEAVAHQLSPREYVSDVINGKRKDPTLSFQLKNGFVVLDIVPDYLEDSPSRGYATLLEWLNPEYVMNVSLSTPEPEEIEQCKLDQIIKSKHHRVRIAAVQYMLRPITCFSDFATQVEFYVHSAQEYNCHFILFPEYFTMQLLSYMRETAPARAVRRLAQLICDYEELFQKLANQNNLYIIAGTTPVIQQGKLYNVAHLFTPNGHIFRQKKVHLTNSEKGPYQMSRGHGFYLYHTEYGNIAILVCYDVEFPEAARVVSEAGAQIIFVPACTDERQGFCRVRYCSQARAIENQVYVAMSGTVGNLPHVPYMATNYGQASILTPSDYFFARDGIAAEGMVNQEQMIVADVDLDLLDEQRINGTVIPLDDMIKDAYDKVNHYTDQVRTVV